MSKKADACSTKQLQNMIEKAAEGMHLGDRVIPSNAPIFYDPEAFSQFADDFMEDPELAIRQLADLNIEVADEAEWVDQYVRLCGSAYRLGFEQEDDEMDFLSSHRPSHHPMMKLLSTPPQWRSVRRAMFIYLRDQLFAAREKASKQGPWYHSLEMADMADLSPEEEDILALLLHFSMFLMGDCEGRDILDFLSFTPSDLMRNLYMLQESNLLLYDLIERESNFRGKGNILRDDFKISELATLKWAGVTSKASEEEEEDSDHSPHRRRNGSSPGNQLGQITTPDVSLDDVVLPEKLREDVEFAITCARQEGESAGLLSSALFGKGQATILLLHGEPGTGKTLVAQAMANSLQRPLLSADMSQLGSPYFWQTEINLGAVFDQAAESGTVLLLDEIDSLNQRSDDFTGGQQHINRLVNVLLTKLENAPEGAVVILCTNRVEALDPAIDRRLTMKLEFHPAQTEKQRMQLWQVHLKDLPVEGVVEEVCSAMAGSYPMLSHGGHIKQVVMTAVRRATMRENAEKLSLSHLKEAAEGIIQQLDLKQKKKMGFSS